MRRSAALLALGLGGPPQRAPQASNKSRNQCLLNTGRMTTASADRNHMTDNALLRYLGQPQRNSQRACIRSSRKPNPTLSTKKCGAGQADDPGDSIRTEAGGPIKDEHGVWQDGIDRQAFNRDAGQYPPEDRAMENSGQSGPSQGSGRPLRRVRHDGQREWPLLDEQLDRG